MEDTLKDLLDLINLLPQIESFKELTDEEVRTLAIDLMKIEEARMTGNGVSNAISHIDLNI